MQYFLHSVELPFSGIKLFYREINCKEQLLLAKAGILYPFGEENNIDYITAIEKIIINCVENKEDFFKLNIIDYVLFLTKLRILSFDRELEITFDKSTEDGMKIKSTINLENFIKILYETISDIKLDKIIEYRKLKTKLKWPSTITKIFLLENKNDISPTITEFIDSIALNESTFINFENFTKKEKDEIFNKLPIKLKKQIEDRILEAITKLIDKNLFNIDNMDWFRFSFYESSYIHFLRLIFSFNLKSLYQEYYLLASKNINLSYIDDISISDKKVYCSMVEEEFKARSQNKSSSINIGSTSLEDLISEFEG
jgi:hypothetical protein